MEIRGCCVFVEVMIATTFVKLVCCFLLLVRFLDSGEINGGARSFLFHHCNAVFFAWTVVLVSAGRKCER